MKRKLRWKKHTVRAGFRNKDSFVFYDGKTTFATVSRGASGWGWSRPANSFGPWMNSWAEGLIFGTSGEARAHAEKAIREMLENSNGEVVE